MYWPLFVSTNKLCGVVRVLSLVAFVVLCLSQTTGALVADGGQPIVIERVRPQHLVLGFATQLEVELSGSLPASSGTAVFLHLLHNATQTVSAVFSGSVSPTTRGKLVSLVDLRQLSLGQGGFQVVVKTQNGETLGMQPRAGALVLLVAPPLLSLSPTTIHVNGTFSSFLLHIRVMGKVEVPASAEVRFNSSCLQAPSLRWERQSGTEQQQVLNVTVVCIPDGGGARAFITNIQAAKVDPSGRAVNISFQQPVISVVPNQVFHRRANRSVDILLEVKGPSLFNSSVRYVTEVMHLPRPVVSAAMPDTWMTAYRGDGDWTGSSGMDGSGLQVKGTISLQAQTSIRTYRLNVSLPLNWSQISPEGEYHLRVDLTPISNIKVAAQPQAVAAFIFGVPNGSCPPGSTQLSSSGVRSKPLLMFGPNAALQDLHLTGCCEGNATQTLDLDPAFNPAQLKYAVRIPFDMNNTVLHVSSSRMGDRVEVDLTSCVDRDVRGMKSTRKVIDEEFGEGLWQESYEVPVNRTECLLVVHVFNSSSSFVPEAIVSSSSMWRGGVMGAGANLTPWAPAAPYKEYLISVMRLTDPRRLQLKAVAFENSTHVLVVCGVPSMSAPGAANTTRSTKSLLYISESGGPNCNISRYLPVPLDLLDPHMELVPELMYPQQEGVSVDLRGNFFLLLGSLDQGATDQESRDAVTSLQHSTSPPSGGPIVSNPPKQNNPPAGTVEVPIIVRADRGQSSKTYTLLIYNNRSSMENMSLEIMTNVTQESRASLKEQVFGSRPPSWPQAPGQNPRCTLCPMGTYSSKVDAGQCSACPPGKYTPIPFSASCLPCPPGTFTSSEGSTLCRKCMPGTVAPQAGSLYCDMCPRGTTTLSEGAQRCDVDLNKDIQGKGIMLSFGLLVNGTSMDQISPDTTGINGTSMKILSLLVQVDTASALNISMDKVHVVAVRQLTQRSLLVNVSAMVPLNEADIVEKNKELSADELIQRLMEDPNTFMRTTKTLDADSVRVTDVWARRVQLGGSKAVSLHAVLWPSLLGSLLLLFMVGWSLWRFWWSRRKTPGVDHDGLPTTYHRWQARSSGGTSDSGQGSSEVELQDLHLAVGATISFTARLRPKQFITNHYIADNSDAYYGFFRRS